MLDAPTNATDPLFVARVGHGDPIVLLHGFTQNHACWRPFADRLLEGHELQMVDLPGHGGSAIVTADLAESAELVARSTGRATYLGYSLGGRVALHLALAHPELVDRLVIIGATAGIEDDAERAERRSADEALADRIERIGTDAFLDEWLTQPLFASIPEESVHREARRSNAASALASSLRLAGTGTQHPLWDRLHTLDMPVLVLAGERDPKFRDLGRRLADSIGDNATFEVVPACRHSTHLENPDGTAELVLRWMQA